MNRGGQEEANRERRSFMKRREELDEKELEIAEEADGDQRRIG